MKASDLDKLFDDGEEDVLQYFDADMEIRPNQPNQRVNVDFPTWMVVAMDEEALRIGVPRQSIIKTWIAEKIEEKTGNTGRQTHQCE